jgi:Holliday junction resolvase-like predicted endonuclease
MQKSSRHSKITGDFGEALVLYWLSKRGFECARVDHTGIDLLARRPNSEEVLGISVKCRSRNEGKEAEGINLLRKDDRKIEAACEAFRCVPYVAVVADQGEFVRVFLLPLAHARALAPGGSWGMTEKKVISYKKDLAIESFELESGHGDWRATI